ncbi:MAG: TIGR00159 family protein [Firmicutes bacterium]|nr:TIGR00159 family protein [Bacillota bacterium]
MFEKLQFLVPFRNINVFSLNMLFAILDVAIVAYVLYKFFMLIKGTRAVQLIKGLVILMVFSTLSNWLHLQTVHWIMQKTWTMLFVALPVVFQPELRRALEQLGRGKFFAQSITTLGEEEMQQVIGEVTRAVQVLARNRMGALIIIERETGLEEHIQTGVKIDGVISAEFLVNIFIPKSPLHDGALIIRGDRVMAAGCFLPLTDDPDLSKELGTRHRAALGITEMSDAVAVVVSEETGVVSIAEEGRLTRYLDDKTLRDMLTKLLRPRVQHPTFLWNWRS